MKKEIQTGDIFAQKLPDGKFMFGRVLLDFDKQVIEPGLIDDPVSNIFSRYQSSYLVESFDLINDKPEFQDCNVVIKGIVMDNNAFIKGLWEIVDFRPVTPSQLDFPEYFGSSSGGKSALVKGELYIPLSFTRQETDACGIKGGYENSYNLARLTLPMLDMGDTLDFKMYIEDNDLRYNDLSFREKIYADIGCPADISYCALALKYGVDTARFLEIKIHTTTIAKTHSRPADRQRFLAKTLVVMTIICQKQ